MIRTLKLGVAALIAAGAFMSLASATPAHASMKGSVQFMQPASGLCMTTDKPAVNSTAGTHLLMRACTGFANQAWYFTSPGVITFAKNGLQVGWDQFGKMELMTSGGETFIYDAPGAPVGTFTAMDGTVTEYLEWAGPAGSPGDNPVRVTPTYNSFTATWDMLAR